MSDNFYQKLAQTLDPALARHPLLDLFIDTLRVAKPDLYEMHKKDHELHPWAMFQVDQTLDMIDNLVEEGYSEEEAKSIALADMLPKAPEDELPYSDEEAAEAEDEGAREAMDLFLRMPDTED